MDKRAEARQMKIKQNIPGHIPNDTTKNQNVGPDQSEIWNPAKYTNAENTRVRRTDCQNGMNTTALTAMNFAPGPNGCRSLPVAT